MLPWRRRIWLGCTRCCVTYFFFGLLQPVATQSSLFYHCTSTMSTPRRELLPRKSWVASMVQVGVVAAVNLSSIDEAPSDCALLTPPGASPLWRPGSIPNNWADVCGFLKLPGTRRFWRVFQQGAFSISRQALGLRSSDPSCHHETLLHLHFIDSSNQWNHQARWNGNIRLTERPTNSGNRALKRHICEVFSDHSLSS